MAVVVDLFFLGTMPSPQAANYLVKKYGYARVSYTDALKEMIVGALVDSPPPIEIASQEFSEMTEAYWRDTFYVIRSNTRVHSVLVA